MTPPNMRRRRVAVLVAVLLMPLGLGIYKAVTWVPRDVRDAAIAASQDDNMPVTSGDEWWVSCDNSPKPTYVCIVTWKQAGRTYADGPADYCVDLRVTVRNGRAERPVLLDDVGACE